MYYANVYVGLTVENSNQKWYECKNPKEHNVFEKDYIWNLATCSYANI